ncbi:hypothetical protein N3K66_002358 [Trichothecium roseum]|uniref:Uncharacterized protein n=1 Tax=Trichothecium roseum TaxID=47278 RepID=A0ACC0VAT0_9HYPO|nr:hypothetical protein N3K66_002358 [Trichothecium roseum]
MPALTVNTDHTTSQNSRAPKSPSPPPMSPITPPQQPAELAGPSSTATTAQPRPQETQSQTQAQSQTQSQQQQQQQQQGPLSLAHGSHPAQVPAAPAPPTQPLDHEANPDVIALRSAISILQMQKQRATSHIRHLEKARAEAMQRPEEFLRDFAQGRVQVGEPPWPRAVHDDEEEEEDDDDDSDDSDEDMQQETEDGTTTKPPEPSKGEEKTWSRLPGPQNVVRCPPVNWSQYAVVGESLDKLHADQQKRPTQGTPATRNPDGTWEHRGGSGQQQQYRGVAAPFSPFVDKVDKRNDGKR